MTQKEVLARALFLGCTVDGGSLTSYDADAQQVECDFLHLLSSCSDEFSVKGGSNGWNIRCFRFCAGHD